MIRFEHVYRRYKIGKSKEKTVLDDICLELPSTGFVVILGPSGSGKTTLLRLLGLLDNPSEGKIYYDDKEIASLSEQEKDQFRHFHIGSIFQDFNLIPHLTVKENIALPLSHLKDHKEKERLVINALKEFGLEEIQDSLPKEISGGEAQRTAFARAIILNQDIILADEPTASVDEENANIILETLQNASKSRLVVLVTHNEEHAKRYGEYLIRLKKGKIVSSTLKETESRGNNLKNSCKSPTSFSTLISLPLKRVMRNKKHYILLTATSTLSMFLITSCLAIQVGGTRFSNNFQSAVIDSMPILIDTYYLNYGNPYLSQDGVYDHPNDGYIYSGDEDSPSYHINRITPDYLDYLKQHIPEKKISYNYGTTFQILHQDKEDHISVFHSNGSDASTNYVAMLNGESKSPFMPISIDQDAFEKNYDLVSGHYPQNENEAYLVVSRNDSVPGDVLNALNAASSSKISYEDILSTTYTFLSNDEYYLDFESSTILESKFLKNHEELRKDGLRAENILSSLTEAYNAFDAGDIDTTKAQCKEIESYFKNEKTSHTLHYFIPTMNQMTLLQYHKAQDIGKKVKITGIYRPSKTSIAPTSNPGIYFTSTLRDILMKLNLSSALAKELPYHLTYSNESGILNIPDAYEIINNVKHTNENIDVTVQALYAFFSNRREYGAEESIQSISLHPSSTEDVKTFRAILDAYNKDKSPIDKIYAIDTASSINGIIDTYYNLVVSILTTISITVALINGFIIFILTQLEIEKRRKEIAIYRSIGTSSSFTCSMFVLEQSWIAFFASILGIALSYATLPLFNSFLEKAITAVYTPSFAYLPFYLALIACIISILVACVSSFIPSFSSSRKPPSSHLKDN